MSKLSDVLYIVGGLDAIVIGIVVLFSVMECAMKELFAVLIYILSILLFIELGVILIAYGAGEIFI